MGVDVKLLRGEIPSGLKCELCLLLMWKPIQTIRGESACRVCYETRKGDSNICPIDQGDILKHEIYTDRAKEREILNLDCYCYNLEIGCTWKGNVAQLAEHQGICSFRKDTCILCSQEVIFYTMDIHRKECLKTLTSVECPYSAFGCKYLADSFETVEKHLAENHYIHTLIFIKAEKEKWDSFKETNKALKQRIQKLETQRDIDKQEFIKKCMSLEKENLEISKVNENLSLITSTDVNNDLKCSDVWETNEYSWRKHCRRWNNEINKLTKSYETTKQNLKDLDLQFKLHVNATFNGNLIWKIDQYAERMSQAIIGKTTALHSAPSYTHHQGYKFCFRIYLNGDGMGKGTHISVFFVLMNSHHDAILEWPFVKQLEFTIINQVNSSNSVTETFKSDPKSSSFQRPKKEMNIASSCPLFIRIDRLNQDGFLKDDCLFFAFKID